MGMANHDNLLRANKRTLNHTKMLIQQRFLIRTSTLHMTEHGTYATDLLGNALLYTPPPDSESSIDAGSTTPSTTTTTTPTTTASTGMTTATVSYIPPSSSSTTHILSCPFFSIKFSSCKFDATLMTLSWFRIHLESPSTVMAASLPTHSNNHSRVNYIL